MTQRFWVNYLDLRGYEQEDIIAFTTPRRSYVAINQLMHRVFPPSGDRPNVGDIITVYNIPDRSDLTVYAWRQQPLLVDLPERDRSMNRSILPFTVPSSFPPNHWGNGVWFNVDQVSGLTSDDLYTIPGYDWLIIPIRHRDKVYYYVWLSLYGDLALDLINDEPLVGRAIDDDDLNVEDRGTNFVAGLPIKDMILIDDK